MPPLHSSFGQTLALPPHRLPSSLGRSYLPCRARSESRLSQASGGDQQLPLRPWTAHPLLLELSSTLNAASPPPAPDPDFSLMPSPPTLLTNSPHTFLTHSPPHHKPRASASGHEPSLSQESFESPQEVSEAISTLIWAPDDVIPDASTDLHISLAHLSSTPNPSYTFSAGSLILNRPKPEYKRKVIYGPPDGDSDCTIALLKLYGRTCKGKDAKLKGSSSTSLGRNVRRKEYGTLVLEQWEDTRPDDSQSTAGVAGLSLPPPQP